MAAVACSYFLALWIRFDCVFSRIQEDLLDRFVQYLLIHLAVSLVIFWAFRLYRAIWRFASYVELFRVVVSSFVSSAVNFILMHALVGNMPISYYVFGLVLQTFFMVSIRFGYRFVRLLYMKRHVDKEATRVMIIGAGSAGQLLLRDMIEAREITARPVCLIDDDENTWGREIEGVPIVGGRDNILASVEKYKIDKIFLAIPSATPEQKRDILSICSASDCELMQLPGIYQLANGEVTVESMKKVSIEDLLGRPPIKPDLTEVFAFLNNKVVMVTGGGGSIGSELCRQIAAHQPKRLIILDIYENSAYAIQLELKEKYPNLDLVVLIASVRDSRKMFDVFKTYRPEVVYHAAAHKHVPLMETSPCEAIKNNAIGTYKTAYAAMINGCRRFVLISTDKAVNPTNIMGASKRLCEMIIQSFDAMIKAGGACDLPQLFTHEGVENADRDGSGVIYQNIRTEFVAVRFGNVLGSNGSVVPIFRRQIEKGGPVTVTHPDIIRYFMTIPEAVSLVLLAGTNAKGGEIFVLDMGSPVKIDTLARNLIRLSGFVPDVDIKIEYSGLRPGEKLYEEKLMAEEGIQKTENDLIYIGKPIPFDTHEFLTALEQLMLSAYANKTDIRERVESIVSTYHPEDAGVTEKIA
ncbi:MAG: polysaccharide biosynthesis protein [Clostridia bacterium]|nr:polysaccharide biosynthesis protein [Clostridia bacterium]